MSKFFRWFNKDKHQQDHSVEQDKAEQLPEDQDQQVDSASDTEQPARSETTPQHDSHSTPPIAPESKVQNSSEQATSAESAPRVVETIEPEPLNIVVPEQHEGLPKDEEKDLELPSQQHIIEHPEPEPEPEPEPVGFFSKLKRGLSRTKENLGSGFISLFKGKSIDDELFEELETQLLVADLGMDTTSKIINNLVERAKRSQLKDGEALYALLKEQLTEILEPVSKPLNTEVESGPFVILMVGVNGVGKTTTIGKLAKQFQQQGKKVMLAAGDTFRAAAVEQLQVWGERNNIPVVAQQTGSDSASVVFDALQSAKAKNVDVLIADTAGRLQNKDHLMEELKKVVRVMKKINPDAPHEIMLTLDAGTGQNALSQARIFHQAVGLSGITLTKLDGTAKGGVIFAVADKFSIPIRYIGVGEGIDDLRPFDGKQFVDALFQQNDE